MPKVFKPMKPIAGPPRIARLAARIRNEEILLELLAKELPDNRIDLFTRIRPFLRFALSPTFLPANLPAMPYTGPRTAAQQLEEAEAVLKKQEAPAPAPLIVMPTTPDGGPSRFERLAGKRGIMMLCGHAETSFEPVAADDRASRMIVKVEP